MSVSEPIVHQPTLISVDNPVKVSPTEPTKTASVWVKIDAAIIAAIATFLGSVYTTNGALFDAKHLEAAGLGAFLGLLYKLEGILNPTGA